jgi:hypothetical protein
MIAAALLLLLLLDGSAATLGSQQLAEPHEEAAIRPLEPHRPHQAERVTLGGPPVRCANAAATRPCLADPSARRRCPHARAASPAASLAGTGPWGCRAARATKCGSLFRAR